MTPGFSTSEKIYIKKLGVLRRYELLISEREIIIQKASFLFSLLVEKPNQHLQ